MERINFSSGYKKYCINDDETAVIRINTRDNAILGRIKTALENLQNLAEILKGIENDNNADNVIKTLAEADQKARDEIDYVFGKGTSEIAFGPTDSCSIVEGQPVFMNFINAVIPLIEKDIMNEQEHLSKRVEKYTSHAQKYSK